MGASGPTPHTRLVGAAAGVVTLAMTACASSARPEAGSSKDATSVVPSAAPATTTTPEAKAAPPASAVDAGDAAAPAIAIANVDAGAGQSSTSPPRVKIVTIGMHVAGGPFDEPTKEPFKKAVEPHFPEIAQCWAKHVPHPPKQADVGVDLMIEAAGGRPKVSNPRSTLGKAPEVEAFVPCVIAVFEAVEFPKLVDRGRTGVSYSLRFTAQ